jgi:hypothetical protein
VFGIDSRADSFDYVIATPVGERCTRCRERIEDGDRGFIRAVVDGSDVRSAPVHYGCEAVGIIGHEFGVCSCTGWDSTTKAAGEELLARIGVTRKVVPSATRRRWWPRRR